jgi:hypothetical protein
MEERRKRKETGKKIKIKAIQLERKEKEDHNNKS